jgi:hypothetical protein
MKHSRTISTLLVFVFAALLLAGTTTSALAAHHEGPVDAPADMVALTVMHRINGLDLGLTSALLPVDVCVNGAYAFTFAFWDTIETEIPAGDYEFGVFLESDNKCAGTPVLSVGPAYLAADSNVMVQAEVTRGGTPELNLWSVVN